MRRKLLESEFIEYYKDNYAALVQKTKILTRQAKVQIPENAEDIVQEVFMKVWQRLEKIDKSKVKEYISTAIYHKFFDHQKKYKTFSKNKEYTAKLLFEDMEPKQVLSVCLINVEDLECLSEKQKDLLRHLLSGGSIREYSDKEKVKFKAVHNRLYRIRKKLSYLKKPMGFKP